ncbi:hypothetical protein M9458_010299, partial [Cirrhinus mrigala]
ENETKSAMRNHTGSHSLGCIEEPKEHEHLNCGLVSTFRSYFQEAAGLKRLDRILGDKLNPIIQTFEHLKTAMGCKHLTTCEEAFPGSKETHKNLEKLRSLLVLYQQWIVKYNKRP